MVRLRSLVGCLVAMMLVATACAAAVRSDRGWVEAADAPSAPLTEPPSSGPVEAATAAPDELAFAAPEEAASAEPAPQADVAEAPTPVPTPQPPADVDEPSISPATAEPDPDHSAADGRSDWAAFETSLAANLAAGAATPPSVPGLVSFERAALAVCAGDVTARRAAMAHGLTDAAERTLNVFTPAMCHLAPIGDDELPSPATDVADWATLIEVRWRHGAQWIDLATFDEQARLACLGLDRSVEMAVSTAAQIDALLVHGECALAWND